jgi:hypothetical protein
MVIDRILEVGTGAVAQVSKSMWRMLVRSDASSGAKKYCAFFHFLLPAFSSEYHDVFPGGVFDRPKKGLNYRRWATGFRI